MRLTAVLSLCVLTACVPTPGAEVSMNQSRLALSASAQMPAAVRNFGTRPGAAPARANADIARDFLDLAFRMESGRTITRFSRFEGPIRLRTAGPVPASAATDLGRLIVRLRSEAGIDISEVAGGEAEITIEFVPRGRIQATYANVACFVIPRVSGWSEFQQARNTPATDWTTLARRERVSIFIPSDGSAQEARDCLHEELAQALGPLNDLYRLSDSVFNDDNFHSALTGFDMLILRAYYDRDLRSGMSEDEVARRLPAILDRLNPAGRGHAPQGAGPTPRVWINQIESALSTRAPIPAREAAARQALAIARAQGWTDSRLALSHFALGRLTLGRDPDTAVAAFAEAGRIWDGLPGGEVHRAHVSMQLAAHALTRGNHAGAAQLIDSAIPVVARAENAALMATLLMMKAEAMDHMDRRIEADALRLDSSGWARYGFGSDDQVRARAREIAALARRS
ncbi:MAG: DUF2927 domain-containing protein [Paracoccaceae bacterium]|nr:MAG: DUF2927 domain-containing protein [Paracoccaceae bacterium]